MATLVFSTYDNDYRNLGVAMDYTAAYDAATDTITITFGDMRFRYWGVSSWGCKHTATVTVDGGDGTSYEGTGYTNGANGGKEFTVAPGTASKTISFTGEGTSQDIVFSVSATAWRYLDTTSQKWYAVKVNKSLTVTFTADRGLVRVGYSNEARKAMTYVPYEGEWRRAIPYTGYNGAWKMGV